MPKLCRWWGHSNFPGLLHTKIIMIFHKTKSFILLRNQKLTSTTTEINFHNRLPFIFLHLQCKNDQGQSVSCFSLVYTFNIFKYLKSFRRYSMSNIINAYALSSLTDFRSISQFIACQYNQEKVWHRESLVLVISISLTQWHDL